MLYKHESFFCFFLSFAPPLSPVCGCGFHAGVLCALLASFSFLFPEGPRNAALYPAVTACLEEYPAEQPTLNSASPERIALASASPERIAGKTLPRSSAFLKFCPAGAAYLNFACSNELPPEARRKPDFRRQMR